MNGNDRVYRDLQKHLDRHPAGFPERESGSDIRLLKSLFTPEQARMTLFLSFAPESVSTILERIQRSGMALSQAELQHILDEMLRRGLVKTFYEGYNEMHYSAPDPVPGGMLSFQLEHNLTREFYEAFKAYWSDLMASTAGQPTTLNPLRVVPVQESIPHSEKFAVGSYDDVRKLVKAAPGPFAVANCICRQKTERYAERCTRTSLREACLILGPDQARRYVDIGIGRFISREEIFAILREAAKDGLVVQPENSQRPEAICLCCGDCCVLLVPMKEHPHPAELFISNYYVTTDSDLCTGCEECVGKCQMDARIIDEGVAVIDRDRCIGCGACVAVCAAEANQLHRKSEEWVPFGDKDSWFMQIQLARESTH